MGILPDTNRFPPHPTEDILEEYVFRRLPDVLDDQVEEHLLVCQSCQDAVTENERFVSAMKAAAKQPAAGLIHSAWQSGLAAIPRSGSSLAPILILAVLALVAVWRHPAQVDLAPVSVNLFSLRGADSMAMAPAGKPLKLDIQTPDLTPGSIQRVEVVDAHGSLVWGAKVPDADGTRVATMLKPLSAGRYWVRLFDANAELVREFGLSAK